MKISIGGTHAMQHLTGGKHKMMAQSKGFPLTCAEPHADKAGKQSSAGIELKVIDKKGCLSK